jgi:hypothetical protein
MTASYKCVARLFEYVTALSEYVTVLFEYVTAFFEYVTAFFEYVARQTKCVAEVIECIAGIYQYVAGDSSYVSRLIKSVTSPGMSLNRVAMGVTAPKGQSGGQAFERPDPTPGEMCGYFGGMAIFSLFCASQSVNDCIAGLSLREPSTSRAAR